MGKIMYNGIEYSGASSFDDATEIPYDNTSSGLKSTDIQSAMDELAKKISKQFEEITDEELEAIIGTGSTDSAMIYTYDTETSYDETEEMIRVENVEEV